MDNLGADLAIWIRGREEPIVKEFRKDKHVNEIYQILSMAVLD